MESAEMLWKNSLSKSGVHPLDGITRTGICFKVKISKVITKLKNKKKINSVKTVYTYKFLYKQFQSHTTFGIRAFYSRKKKMNPQ